MADKKIGIISQARMTSTRLPGKILKEANGKPLLQYHIDRLKWSGLPIYLATTTNDTDDVLVAFAEKNGIPYSRGSEDNVLSRYYECAQKYGLDIIIRVTSDCPLIDGHLIKAGVDKYLELNDDNYYLSNTLERTFPRGFDYDVFSFALLEEAWKNAILEYDKEHVTPYILQNKSGHVKLLNLSDGENNSELRITLDTPEDYELFLELIEHYHAYEMDYKQIIHVLLTHPKLVEINAHIEQKKV